VTDRERIERVSKPVRCPNCGHSPVADVLYGGPAFSEKLDEDYKVGRVTPGGGGGGDSYDDPAWRCDRCGLAIYRRRP
jgi:ribosomal protein S27AE